MNMPSNEFSPNRKERQGQKCCYEACTHQRTQSSHERVDGVNQQLHTVSPLQKKYKWYKRLAIRITMQMAFNAQKIYVIKTGQKMTFLQFMKNLVLSCVTILEGLPENMSPDENVICLTSCHFPSCCYQTQTQNFDVKIQ